MGTQESIFTRNKICNQNWTKKSS